MWGYNLCVILLTISRSHMTLFQTTHAHKLPFELELLPRCQAIVKSTFALQSREFSFPLDTKFPYHPLYSRAPTVYAICYSLLSMVQSHTTKELTHVIAELIHEPHHYTHVVIPECTIDSNTTCCGMAEQAWVPSPFSQNRYRLRLAPVPGIQELVSNPIGSVPIFLDTIPNPIRIDSTALYPVANFVLFFVAKEDKVARINQ